MPILLITILSYNVVLFRIQITTWYVIKKCYRLSYLLLRNLEFFAQNKNIFTPHFRANKKLSANFVLMEVWPLSNKKAISHYTVEYSSQIIHKGCRWAAKYNFTEFEEILYYGLFRLEFRFLSCQKCTSFVFFQNGMKILYLNIVYAHSLIII